MTRIGIYPAAKFTENDLVMLQIVIDVLPEESELREFLAEIHVMLTNGDDIVLCSVDPESKT